jgi:hypothetical protein
VVSIEMIEAVGHEHLPSYFATINAALRPGGTAVIQVRWHRVCLQLSCCCAHRPARTASPLPHHTPPRPTQPTHHKRRTRRAAPHHQQVIAQPDERYEAYCRGCDFIREHIFPGGHLPSLGAMVEAARGTQVSMRPRRVHRTCGVPPHSMQQARTSRVCGTRAVCRRWHTCHCADRLPAHLRRLLACGHAQLSIVKVRDIGPDYAITLRAWRQAWRVRAPAPERCPAWLACV